MTIIVRHVGERWTVEVGGRLVGEASSEANAEALIANLDRGQKWVSSWRFC